MKSASSRKRGGISDDNPEWNRINAEAEQREQDAEMAADCEAELRGLVRDLTTALENRNRALEESVKLQSHYAVLLNVIDGGRRLTFDCGQDWIDRLRYLASQDPLRRTR